MNNNTEDAKPARNLTMSVVLEEAPEQTEESSAQTKLSAKQDWQMNIAAVGRYSKSQQWKETLELLSNMSKKHKNHEMYKALAQRVWVALKSGAPVTDVVLSLFHLLNTLGPRHEVAGPVAALAHLMAKHRTPDHPDRELAQAQAQQMFSLVLDAVGIVGDDAFEKWVDHNRLNDPNNYIPIVLNLLEVMVGDKEEDWWIDRSLLQQEMESIAA